MDTLINLAKSLSLIHYIYIILGLILFIFDRYLKVKSQDIRNKFKEKSSKITDFKAAEEESMIYHFETQKISTFRMIGIIAYIILVLLIQYNAYGSITTATITLTALILVIREPLASLLGYFYIITNFRIADTVGIDDIIGEIVYIKLLSVGIAGKENSGEYSGKLHIIPNYLFLSKPQEQRKLKLKDYRKSEVIIYYIKNQHTINFNEWLVLLRQHLDNLLPERSLHQVDVYKSYAGLKYKIDYDQNEKSDIVVTISFISSYEPLTARKESILIFTEQLKNNPYQA